MMSQTISAGFIKLAQYQLMIRLISLCDNKRPSLIYSLLFWKVEICLLKKKKMLNYCFYYYM